ncbi:MAG: hypothetical protein II858_02195 [Bacteroidales bacterium]|nr:hypothetical protein [Bacteroidales bacterium]
MVKDKDIKQFMLRHQPEVKNSGPFLKDIVRQINAMPVPAAMNPARQKEDCIRLVLEVSRRDMRTVRLAVSVIVVVVILSAITISMIPSDLIPSIPTAFFQFK